VTARVVKAQAAAAALVACALATACASSETRSSGTIYVDVGNRATGKQPDYLVVRNGAVVGHLAYWSMAVARDQPSTLLFRKAVLMPSCCGQRDQSKRVFEGDSRVWLGINGRQVLAPAGCFSNNSGMALSPTGRFGICETPHGLVVFAVSDPARSAKFVFSNMVVNTGRDAAFLSDYKVIVGVRDQSCPEYHGNLWVMAQPTRFVIADLIGKVLSRGPCAYGAVSGIKRVAFMRYDTSGAILYSFGGSDWFAGTPEAFDGSDRLIYLDRQYRLRLEGDGQVYQGVASEASWSR